MKVVAIHSALAFCQAPYMKSYVNMNAEKRAKTTNKFDADFYKLSMNSLFGKTIENPKKCTKVKLCQTRNELEKQVGHYSFKHSKIINKNLVRVEMKNSLVKINKPFYVGNAVLELSKFHVYNFHYNVMKPLFDDQIQLLYTDTDSLMYEIESEDPYAKFGAMGNKGWFDFSKFPQNHALHDDSNKRIYREIDKGAQIFVINPEGSYGSEAELTLQGIQRSNGGKILKYTGHDIIITYDVISIRDPV